MKKKLSIIFVVIFTSVTVWSPVVISSESQGVMGLPAPGSVLSTSVPHTPPTLKGISLDPDNPFKFHFIIDQGQVDFSDDEKLHLESMKLIKYFLAALTLPEKEMWVNLSPYEADRIIPEEFSRTEMGRDLLAQDYLLKQLSASLLDPEEEIGRKVWNAINKNAGATQWVARTSQDLFNKIWIVPNKAEIYEHARGAFVVSSHLDVMLEEDYMARRHSEERSDKESKHEILRSQFASKAVAQSDNHKQMQKILHQTLLPTIEKEINEGKTFANLRQIYHSMILAVWYKKVLRESILGEVYVDQHKTGGIALADQNVHKEIYDQYVASFKKGVYDFIQEDYDPVKQTVIPRRYFSGGAVSIEEEDLAMASREKLRNVIQTLKPVEVEVNLKLTPISDDDAMLEVGGNVKREGALKNLFKDIEFEGITDEYLAAYKGSRAGEIRKIEGDVPDKAGVELMVAVGEFYQRAVVTGSRNALGTLGGIGANEGSHYDFLVDRHYRVRKGLRGKPEPDLYIAATQELGVEPADAVAIDDATESPARAELGLVIGVDRLGDPDGLIADGANVVVSDMSEITPEKILQWYARVNGPDKKPKAILFDLDGVLALNASYQARANQEVLDAYLSFRESRVGLPQGTYGRFTEQDAIDYVYGKDSLIAVQRFLESRGIVLPRQSLGDDAGSLAKPEVTGGIDFDPENLDMNIDKNKDGFQMSIPKGPLTSQDVESIVPVIIQISPALNLPLMLGFNSPSADQIGYSQK